MGPAWAGTWTFVKIECQLDPLSSSKSHLRRNQWLPTFSVSILVTSGACPVHELWDSHGIPKIKVHIPCSPDRYPKVKLHGSSKRFPFVTHLLGIPICPSWLVFHVESRDTKTNGSSDAYEQINNIWASSPW